MTTEEEIGRFKDKTGREWVIDLSIGLCADVRKQTGIDLANWHDGKASQALWTSDEKLVEVLWVLIEEQANKSQVGPEQFARALNGDALAGALNAIEAAIVGFTRPDRRELIRQIRDKSREVQTQVVGKAIEKLASDKTSKLIATAIDKAAAKIDAQLEKSLTSGV